MIRRDSALQELNGMKLGSPNEPYLYKCSNPSNSAPSFSNMPDLDIDLVFGDSFSPPESPQRPDVPISLEGPNTAGHLLKPPSLQVPQRRRSIPHPPRIQSPRIRNDELILPYGALDNLDPNDIILPKGVSIYSGPSSPVQPIESPVIPTSPNDNGHPFSSFRLIQKPKSVMPLPRSSSIPMQRKAFQINSLTLPTDVKSRVITVQNHLLTTKQQLKQLSEQYASKIDEEKNRWKQDVKELIAKYQGELSRFDQEHQVKKIEDEDVPQISRIRHITNNVIKAVIKTKDVPSTQTPEDKQRRNKIIESQTKGILEMNSIYEKKIAEIEFEKGNILYPLQEKISALDAELKRITHSKDNVVVSSPIPMQMPVDRYGSSPLPLFSSCPSGMTNKQASRAVLKLTLA